MPELQKNDVVEVVYEYVLMGMQVWSLMMMMTMKLNLDLGTALMLGASDVGEEACYAILEPGVLDMRIMEHDWSKWTRTLM